jgi:molybdenum cofactor sulfurtransferase
MDFTGSSLYLNSQVHAAADELLSGVFGNPHSINPSSQLTTRLVDALRERLLQFFGTDSNEYELVFVRSATGALQALGESFPWTRDSHFAYLVSNHNSVLGKYRSDREIQQTACK